MDWLEWLNGMVMGQQRSKLDCDVADVLFKALLAVWHVPICAPHQQLHHCYFDSWTSAASSWTTGSPSSQSSLRMWAGVWHWESAGHSCSHSTKTSMWHLRVLPDERRGPPQAGAALPFKMRPWGPYPETWHLSLRHWGSLHLFFPPLVFSCLSSAANFHHTFSSEPRDKPVLYVINTIVNCTLKAGLLNLTHHVTGILYTTGKLQIRLYITPSINIRGNILANYGLQHARWWQKKTWRFCYWQQRVW